MACPNQTQTVAQLYRSMGIIDEETEREWHEALDEMRSRVMRAIESLPRDTLRMGFEVRK